MQRRALRRDAGMLSSEKRGGSKEGSTDTLERSHARGKKKGAEKGENTSDGPRSSLRTVGSICKSGGGPKVLVSLKGGVRKRLEEEQQASKDVQGERRLRETTAQQSRRVLRTQTQRERRTWRKKKKNLESTERSRPTLTRRD